MIIKNYGGRLMETNSTIFYTTAQVTEMVELSDQNVRKYVRLLEDRNYEVAKDEHNRRLFSGDDIAILKELIVLAKQPGYTLETAADQLVNNEPSNVVNAQTRVPSVATTNEFTELLSSVVERMDDMRHEQNELKEKMDLLISKLEQTSSTFERSMITHDEKKEENDTAATADETVSDDTEAPSVETSEDDQTAEAADVAAKVAVEDNKEDVKTEESSETLSEDVTVNEEEAVESSEAAQMFEAEKRQNEKRIDMTTYESASAEENREEEAPKEEKGAFGRFLDFLKGK